MKAFTYLREEMCPSQRGLRKVIGEKTQAHPNTTLLYSFLHWDPASQKAKAQPGCLRKTVLRSKHTETSSGLPWDAAHFR